VLPTIKTDIEVEWGETPRLKIADVTDLTTQPAQDQMGTPTRLSGAQAMTAFQMTEGQPARPSGTAWNDPDIGSWEPRSGMIVPFNWQA
jgi:hypothetical protein